jgi:hypothetical protein
METQGERWKLAVFDRQIQYKKSAFFSPPRQLNTNSFLVFCDFSKPAMTANPIFHDHEERKTKYSVSRTSTWGCFILHELSHLWQGANAGEEEGPEAFAPVSIILDPLLDKTENIFWWRTLITDDMKGDRADAYTTHIGRRSLLLALPPLRIAPLWPQCLSAISFALIDPPRLHYCQIVEKCWVYLLDWILFRI